MKKSSQQGDTQLEGTPSDSISSLRCSADGALLAATSWDNSVRHYASRLMDAHCVAKIGR